jgi:hypothetical protein
LEVTVASVGSVDVEISIGSVGVETSVVGLVGVETSAGSVGEKTSVGVETDKMKHIDNFPLIFSIKTKTQKK